MKKLLLGKLKESLLSVLPIPVIVLLIHFTIAPLPIYTLLLFLSGSILLIFGMSLFTLGADISMMVMGEKIGAHITKFGKLPIIMMIIFIIGLFITIAEPDLQVLARQTPAVPDMVLIVAVAVGVGIFLVVSFLRIFFQIKLSYILIFLYIIVFTLAVFTQENFLAVAFDSGGVTTGPITVPFIMALGIGLSMTRGDKTAEEDSFGLVALCSVGPILTVLILGMFYNSSAGSYSAINRSEMGGLSDILNSYLHHTPEYMKEVLLALLPIIVFFLLFQIIALKLKKRQLLKITVGVLYTYLGLVIFLTSVNVGFLPVGYFLGGQIVNNSYGWLLVPLGMVIGFFIVAAEPAVHVLKQQVEEITHGAISGRSMGISLSIGVAVSVGLAMLRVVTGLSIWYLIIPGYLIALVLTFFVPSLFTAIAFDSGGVASGPMTATFLLPFAMGATEAVGGNILKDAFGIVAMVAMTPLITIQCLGLVYRIKSRKTIPMDELPIQADDIIEFEDENETEYDGSVLSILPESEYNVLDTDTDVLINKQEDDHGTKTT